MEKLKVESADIRVSNSNQTDRIYDIAANAHISGGQLTEISGGSVNALPHEGGAMGPAENIASFNMWQGGSLNVTFQTEDNRASVLTEIEAFIGKCRTDKELTANDVNA